MWVILGTVFLDEAWFEDSEVVDYMEVWYWSAILSGEFKIEQNRAFIRNLQNVLSEIQNIKESDKKFTKALCNNVLSDKKFADRDIVLMKNPSVYPEEVIGNTICQFYLSETYSDILKPASGEKRLSATNTECIKQFREAAKTSHYADRKS